MTDFGRHAVFIYASYGFALTAISLYIVQRIVKRHRLKNTIIRAHLLATIQQHLTKEERKN